MGCDGAPGSMRFKCVHEDQVCDGVPTCQDMSDEMDCFHFTDPLVPPASGQRLWCVLPSPTLVTSLRSTRVHTVSSEWTRAGGRPRRADIARMHTLLKRARRKGVGYWRISAFAPTNMDYVRRTWLETDVLPRLATTARRCAPTTCRLWQLAHLCPPPPPAATTASRWPLACLCPPAPARPYVLRCAALWHNARRLLYQSVVRTC